MAQNDRDLTTGSVFKKLTGFALPLLFSCFMQAFYGAVDLWTVGRFGTTSDLAAVNIGAQVTQILIGLCIGVSVGVTVRIGHCVGAKDARGADRAVGNSIWIFGAAAVILTPVLALCAKPLAGLLQTPAEAIEQAGDYLRICGVGVPFMIAYNAIGAILRGDGNSKMPTVFIGVACVVNIAGDLLLTGVFGLGVTGVATATVFAQAVSAVIGVVHLRRKGLSFPVTRSGLAPHAQTLRRVLFNGLPIAVQDTLINISFIAITVIANTRGVTDASAVGVTEKIVHLMFLFPSAMMSALSAFTAQNIGAQKHDRAVKAVRYGIVLTLVFGTACCLSSQFTGETLASIFSKDGDVIRAAAQYLRTYTIDCVVVAFSFCLNGYFCGVDKSFIVFVHNAISAFGVRIPLALLFSNRYPDTLLPMGLASPIGSLVSLAICGVFLLYLRKTGAAPGKRKRQNLQ